MILVCYNCGNNKQIDIFIHLFMSNLNEDSNLDIKL